MSFDDLVKSTRDEAAANPSYLGSVQHREALEGWLQAIVPDWSWDGRRLTFTRAESFGASEPGDIYTSNVDGTRLRRITTSGKDKWDFAPRWSPNGRMIAFVRETNTGVTLTFTVFTVSASGGRPRKLVDGMLIHSVSWSPDGKQIAYMDQSTIHNRATIHIFTLATGTDRAFTPGPCRDLDTYSHERCFELDWRRTP